MIISRTPFRMSFAGGGSDLRAFYSKHPGQVLSTTINKYMYIAVHPFFGRKRIQVKYAKTELVDDVNQIQHPIVREVLKKFGLRGIDINSIADIPAGTGLASSSAFTVGLLHVLYAYQGKFVSQERLAQEACELEIDILKEPIGKQDQYASAYGGLNVITFNPDEHVKVEPLILPRSTMQRLNDGLLLFYTGDSRATKAILAQVVTMSAREDTVRAVKRMADLVVQFRDALVEERLDDFGRLLHEGWLIKRSLTGEISSPRIDAYYERALQAGALGGKLLGAGGGGFLLFYSPPARQQEVRRVLAELPEQPFRFDFFGSKIIYVGDKDWA
jgi:D-glycero-alpha-D-manno-heptose-7-phosphate kinase